MFVTMKFKLSIKTLQFSTYFLKMQGIRDTDLKAMTTGAESVSIHRFLQFLLCVNSIALCTHDSSTWNAVPRQYSQQISF